MQKVILTGPPIEPERLTQASSRLLSLVIIWSAREPHRVGERALCCHGHRYILGRAPSVDSNESALGFSPLRPGQPEPKCPRPHGDVAELLGESLSRRQLEVVVDSEFLSVRNIGRCPMWINGRLTGTGRVAPGDTIHLQRQLLLLCVQEPLRPTGPRHYPMERASVFGHPDQDGIVGESHAVWQLREDIAASAQSEGHVLVLGPTGSGKELVAQTVHQLSNRRKRPLVIENVSTMPASLGAALLFGNRRNFPNPGMEERKGLLGMAEGGSLFLDELGDMNAELQPMLLRVMERTGEYTRLGEESQPRRADVRVIGATNRPERLRMELRRRFHHEIVVPGLSSRREDIPLLVRQMLKTSAAARRHAARFLQNGEPSVDPLLIEQLVHHPYLTHVAELAFLVERAIKDSVGDVLLPFAQTPQLVRSHPEVIPETTAPPIGNQDSGLSQTSTPPLPPPRLPTPEQAQKALNAANGSVVRAAAALSITRHQLNRMIRKSGLTLSRP